MDLFKRRQPVAPWTVFFAVLNTNALFGKAK
jgi:hypothetical protein